MLQGWGGSGRGRESLLARQINGCICWWRLGAREGRWLHEEIVIERNAIDNEPTDRPIRAEDSIHIPVSREKVEVGKHTVITGEVAVKKRAVDDIHHVDENLKHEEIRVHKDGDPNIVDSNIKG